MTTTTGSDAVDAAPSEPGVKPKWWRVLKRHTWRNQEQDWDHWLLAESRALTQRQQQRSVVLNEVKERLARLRSQGATRGSDTEADSGAATQLQDLEATLERLDDEFDRDMALAPTLKAAAKRLRDRQLAELRWLRKRNTSLSWLGVGVALAVTVLSLVDPSWWWADPLHRLHMAFFAAVAAIAPVLLVAAFVEIAALRMPDAPAVLFQIAIPTFAAGTCSLWALASDRSTTAVANVSVNGLATAAILVLFMASLHVSEVTARSSG